MSNMASTIALANYLFTRLKQLGVGSIHGLVHLYSMQNSLCITATMACEPC